MFRLAGHLGMTVSQLCQAMDSRELSEWMAMHRYYSPLPDSWRETGLIASAALAPYCPRGKTPKAEDFVPIDKPPQHELQLREQLEALKRQMGQQ
jgi:hypothetical protein